MKTRTKGTGAHVMSNAELKQLLLNQNLIQSEPESAFLVQIGDFRLFITPTSGQLSLELYEGGEKLSATVIPASDLETVVNLAKRN